MVFQLDDKLAFPDPRNGEPDGLLAVGGDLGIDRLLLAYSYGIFPWYDFRKPPILWYCPMQRFVIFPNEIHISHSMRTLLRKHQYRVTVNACFDRVISACSEMRINEEGAWLGDDMIKAYTELHEQGFCASVEVWDGEPMESNLVGGLYGVDLGTVFIGESMFSRVPSASKIALIHLARLMEVNGGQLIDCQLRTPHLESMGGRYIPYQQYLDIMGVTLEK